MIIVPIGKRIVAKAATKEEKTVGGIILADSVDKNDNTVEIVSVSKECDIPIKKGSIVLLSISARKQPVEGSEHFIIHANDVIAKLVKRKR